MRTTWIIARSRAAVYFRAPEFEAHFDAWRRERALTPMPVVAIHSVVCRDDLLLELAAAAPA